MFLPQRSTNGHEGHAADWLYHEGTRRCTNGHEGHAAESLPPSVTQKPDALRQNMTAMTVSTMPRVIIGYPHETLQAHKKSLTRIASSEAHRKKVGGDLLSRGCAVPSARSGLTSLFGMGRGGTPPQ